MRAFTCLPCMPPSAHACSGVAHLHGLKLPMSAMRGGAPHTSLWLNPTPGRLSDGQGHWQDEWVHTP
eukprot:362542-Chlamydomonas_euryale.AAC.4